MGDIKDVKLEVIEYARYLGMELPRDAKYLWIAEEGMAAELPAGWQEFEDAEGRPYFHNAASGETAWTHPPRQQQVYKYEPEPKQRITTVKSKETPE